MEGGVLLGDLAAALKGEAEGDDEDAPHGPAGEVPEEGGHHGGVDAGVGASAEDRSGVLGAPPADGHVDDGHVDGGEDGEYGGEDVRVWPVGEKRRSRR